MEYIEIEKMNSGYLYGYKRKEVKYMYWLTGLAGVVFMAAPYAFGYADNVAALWTSLIAGVIVLGSSVWEALESRKENWEYWIAGFVGLLAIISPFILGFGNHATAMWTTIIMGAVIAILAGSKLWTGGESHI